MLNIDKTTLEATTSVLETATTTTWLDLGDGSSALVSITAPVAYFDYLEELDEEEGDAGTLCEMIRDDFTEGELDGGPDGGIRVFWELLEFDVVTEANLDLACEFRVLLNRSPNVVYGFESALDFVEDMVFQIKRANKNPDRTYNASVCNPCDIASEISGAFDDAKEEIKDWLI